VILHRTTASTIRAARGGRPHTEPSTGDAMFTTHGEIFLRPASPRPAPALPSPTASRRSSAHRARSRSRSASCIRVGTMAISEVSLRDVVLMAVDEINAKGGVMGRPIQPVWSIRRQLDCSRRRPSSSCSRTRSPSSSAAGRRSAASRCCRSSRTTTGCSSIPCSTKRGVSKNVFYHGRHAEPAADPGRRISDVEGGRRLQEVLLAGHGLVFPRTANKILRAFLLAKACGREHRGGVPRRSVIRTPTIVGKIKRFSSAAARACCRRSTATATCPSTRSLHQGLRSETRRSWRTACRGRAARHGHLGAGRHLAAWNYFQSIENANNKKF